MHQNINVIIAADNNYSLQCATTIVSIIKNTASKVVFYILDGNISSKNKKKILKFEEQHDCKIKFCDMSTLKMPNFPLNRQWISLATYYRLFLLDVIPQAIEKAIYLDCDIIAEGDIRELWDYDISNYAAAVCEDNDSIKHSKRLHLSDTHTYFNAGVLLLNLTYLRQSKFKEMAFEYFNKNSSIITMQDQDILNGIWENKCLLLPIKYNADTTLYRLKLCPYNNYKPDEIEEARRKPILIHYTGSDKPWLYYSTHPMRERYYYYFKYTFFKYQKFKLDLIKILQIFIHYQEHNNQKFISIMGVKIYESKHTPIEQIFSIKNSSDKKHKIITLFGIKLKIPRKLFSPYSLRRCISENLTDLS